jgi:hypothetical protein
VLYAILENWDFEKFGNISIRKIAMHFPISKEMVGKYYWEFKDYLVSLYLEGVIL